LTQAGRWPEALTRYRCVEGSSTTRHQAIQVPFEVADHYRSIGETAAAERVLERALEHFAGIREENRGAPAARWADEGKVKALGELGRWEDAVQLLLQFPESYPGDSGNAMAVLKAAHITDEHLNDPQRAAEILERLAATSPDSILVERFRQEATRLRTR